jgi:hypothetical protein
MTSARAGDDLFGSGVHHDVAHVDDFAGLVAHAFQDEESVDVGFHRCFGLGHPGHRRATRPIQRYQHRNQLPVHDKKPSSKQREQEQHGSLELLADRGIDLGDVALCHQAQAGIPHRAVTGKHAMPEIIRTGHRADLAVQSMVHRQPLAIDDPGRAEGLRPLARREAAHALAISSADRHFGRLTECISFSADLGEYRQRLLGDQCRIDQPGRIQTQNASQDESPVPEQLARITPVDWNAEACLGDRRAGQRVLDGAMAQRQEGKSVLRQLRRTRLQQRIARWRIHPRFTRHHIADVVQCELRVNAAVGDVQFEHPYTVARHLQQSAARLFLDLRLQEGESADAGAERRDQQQQCRRPENVGNLGILLRMQPCQPRLRQGKQGRAQHQHSNSGMDSHPNDTGPAVEVFQLQCIPDHAHDAERQDADGGIAGELLCPCKSGCERADACAKQQKCQGRVRRHPSGMRVLRLQRSMQLGQRECRTQVQPQHHQLLDGEHDDQRAQYRQCHAAEASVGGRRQKRQTGKCESDSGVDHHRRPARMHLHHRGDMQGPASQGGRRKRQRKAGGDDHRRAYRRQQMEMDGHGLTIGRPATCFVIPGPPSGRGSAYRTCGRFQRHPHPQAGGIVEQFDAAFMSQNNRAHQAQAQAGAS